MKIRFKLLIDLDLDFLVDWFKENPTGLISGCNSFVKINANVRKLNDSNKALSKEYSCDENRVGSISMAHHEWLLANKDEDI